MNPGCHCTSDKGRQMWSWMHVGDQIWVHPDCGQPSPAGVENDMTNIPLQYFYAGPLHNTLVTATDLLHTARTGIAEYRWTPQTLVGSQTGSQARVWAHKSVDDYAVKTFLDALSQ